MRKIALILFLLFSGSIMGLMFSNCGQNHLSTQDNESSNSTDVKPLNPPKPFADNKVDFNWYGVERMAQRQGATAFAQKIRAATKSSEIILPQGLKFIINVDKSCEQLESSKLFSWADKSFSHSNLTEQSFPALLPEGMFFSELQELTQQDPCIIGISNDDLLEANAIDPLYTSQSHLAAIEHEEFYNLISQPTWGGNQPVVVAVIDSGIDYNHPDLRNNLWRNASGQYGYDFENGDTDPRDDFGHGTAVAGLIAAESDNGVGVRGVMGKNIKIMSLKVQDSEGGGSVANVVAALDYARAQGVDVINLSMSGTGTNQSLRTALLNAVNANIFIALAAGNNGALITSTSPIMPAIYGAEANGIVTVGSVDSGNIFNRSSFSNYSSTYVELTAPGNQNVYFPQMNGSYNTGSGTSYSAPLAAGAAAAVISFFKTNNIPYNAGEVEALLSTTALSAGSLTQYVRSGRILHFGNLKNYLSSAYLGNQTGGMDEF